MFHNSHGIAVNSHDWSDVFAKIPKLTDRSSQLLVANVLGQCSKLLYPFSNNYSLFPNVGHVFR